MVKYQVLQHQHIFEREKHFKQCHASTVLELSNKEVMVAWFAGDHEKHPNVAIWMNKTVEGKWTEPVKVADVEDIPCWNPVLALHNDKVILYYKIGQEIPWWQTMVIESHDLGETWSEPRELVEGDKGGRGPVKNKMIILKNGTWLAPASNETWTEWECFIDVSKDNGKTWSNGGYIPLDRSKLKDKGIIQPTLWEDENNIVHLLARSSEGFAYYSKSEDGGLTWSEALPTQLPNNNSGLDAVNLENGDVVVVYNDVTENWGQRSPIGFAISKDNGQSWGEYEILDYAYNKNRDREFSYPAIIRGEDNTIHITYTWNRATISYWKIKILE